VGGGSGEGLGTTKPKNKENERYISEEQY
jgi:hypothetical protein